MPNQGEQFIPFRDVAGVDLRADARTHNPSSMAKCKNAFSVVKGRLRKRPGSTALTSGFYWNDGSNDLEDAVRSSGSMNAVLRNQGHTAITVRFPKMITHLNRTISAHTDIDTDLVIGAMAFTERGVFPVTAETLRDAPFYLDPVDDKIVIMEHLSNIFSAGAGRWDSVQVGHSETSVNVYNPADSGGSGIETIATGTDDKDKVLGLITDTTGILAAMIEDTDETPGTTHNLVRCYGLAVQQATGGNQFVIKKVKALGSYRGCAVIGGFQLQKFGAGPTYLGAEEEDYSHFAGFLDLDNINKFGVSATIRVGENPNEPITAIGTVAALSDSAGFREQLALFTRRKMMIYDGDPPQSEAAEGAGFRNLISADVGTLSQATVLNTTMGLVFLGSDGMVYIIRPGEQYPSRIGRPIQPRLKKLTEQQLKNAYAVFDGRFYRLHIPVPDDVGSLAVGEEWWVDLYDLNNAESNDFGARWYGPMERYYAAWGPAVLVNGKEKLPQIYAGGALQAVIFTENGEYEAADDDGTDIDIWIESQAFDGGDAHIEKEFTRLDLGISASKQVTVSGTIAGFSNKGGTNASSAFSTTVSAPGSVYGGTGVTYGTDGVNFGSRGGYRLVSHTPGQRVRGRTLKFVVTESSDANVEIHDLVAGLRPTPRRGT